MNVIVSNQQQNQLSTLDIDIIKSISGTYEANEIVEMFKNFFYNKMILDVTAIRNCNNIETYQIIAKGLDVEKIVFYLPEGSELCTSSFLGSLVSLGIYNFTTNIDGVKYLLNKPNTYKEVAHIEQLSKQNNMPTNSSGMSTGNNGIPQGISITKKTIDNSTIVGFRNVTLQAGATTFIYMLKKELSAYFGDKVVAIEVNKTDFQFFNDKSMISTSQSELRNVIEQHQNNKIILIDLNDLDDDNICGEVFYLLEPTTIKLNRLIKRNRTILTKLKNKKIILNKSLLNSKDISDFEYESGLKVFYNMPPLNERKRNEIMSDFIARIGLIERNNPSTDESGNRIFGLFRR